MKFGNNVVAFSIALDSGRLLVGAVSIVGRLSLGLFVIVGRKALLEGPRTVEAARWLKAQTPIFMKKSHMLINPHFREAGRILKALIIIFVSTLRAKVGPRIITTGHKVGQEFNRLIVKTMRRRERGITESIKKNREALHMDQAEENINGDKIPADQS
jgi:hypothetical protein